MLFIFSIHYGTRTVTNFKSPLLKIMSTIIIPVYFAIQWNIRKKRAH